MESYVRDKFETEYYSLVVNSLHERESMKIAEGDEEVIKKMRRANKSI